MRKWRLFLCEMFCVLLFFSAPAFAQITGIGAADAISRLNRPRGDSRIGNSMDTGSGAYLVTKQVLEVNGGRTLAFALTYNSLLTSTRGATGYGWSHNYEALIEGNPRRHGSLGRQLEKQLPLCGVRFTL